MLLTETDFRRHGLDTYSREPEGQSGVVTRTLVPISKPLILSM
jgi:hypothetical protein